MTRPARFLIVTWILFLAVTGRTAVGQTSQHRPSDAQRVRDFRDGYTLLERARVLYAKKDFAGTKKQLTECLKVAPELSEAHFMLAKVLYIEKDYAGALSEVVEAKTDFQATAGMRESMKQDRLNWLRERKKGKEDAITDLRAKLATTPADQQFGVQQQIIQLEGERSSIDRELQEPPKLEDQVPAEYSFIHGNVLLRMQKLDEAVAQYQEALKVRPDYGDAANNLASLYYAAKRYDKALAVVEKAAASGAVVNPELKKAIEEGLRTPR